MVFRKYFLLTSFVALGISALAPSGKQPSKKAAQAAEKKDVYYACSMHPQVHEDHPGKCPICGMDLIAVPKSGMQAGNEVRLNGQQIKLGNIQVDTVSTGSIGGETVLTGTLNFNQENYPLSAQGWKAGLKSCM